MFAAICKIHGSGLRVTLPNLCDEFGFVSRNAAFQTVNRLVAMGWVRRDRGIKGGIVPLYSMTIYLEQKTNE